MNTDLKKKNLFVSNYAGHKKMYKVPQSRREPEKSIKQERHMVGGLITPPSAITPPQNVISGVVSL